MKLNSFMEISENHEKRFRAVSKILRKLTNVLKKFYGRNYLSIGECMNFQDTYRNFAKILEKFFKEIVGKVENISRKLSKMIKMLLYLIRS